MVNFFQLIWMTAQMCLMILRWKFFQSRDDNFEFIKSQIPNKIDVLFIDTLHEASHVKKLIFAYYPLLNNGGYIFIDDISHLPYLKNKDRITFIAR